MPYPIIYLNERTLPEDYDGPIYVWDVDKTYLATHFSSLEGLARLSRFNPRNHYF